MANWEGFVRSGSGLIELLCSQERLRKTTKNSAVVADVPSEILTEHLPNKILDDFHCTCPLAHGRHSSLIRCIIGFTTEATVSSNNDHVIKIIQCAKGTLVLSTCQRAANYFTAALSLIKSWIVSLILKSHVRSVASVWLQAVVVYLVTNLGVISVWR
jgi:hypothetical protein